MHRCGSSTNSHYHNMVGPCSCGCNGNHYNHHQTNAVVFSVPTIPHKRFDESEVYAVDCTLSLGTPSTRLGAEKPSKKCVSNFCWDLLKPKSSSHHSAPPEKSVRGGGDSVLARRCTNCDTTSTPLWRNGPKGPKSLCNACGIRFKKEERRATAATTTAASSSGGGATDAQQHFHHVTKNNNSWVQQQHDQSQKLQCFSPAIGNEFRISGDSGGIVAADGGISFLSWRLNVTDRPAGLVHDFTR